MRGHQKHLTVFLTVFFQNHKEQWLNDGAFSASLKGTYPTRYPSLHVQSCVCGAVRKTRLFERRAGFLFSTFSDIPIIQSNQKIKNAYHDLATALSIFDGSLHLVDAQPTPRGMHNSMAIGAKKSKIF